MERLDSSPSPLNSSSEAEKKESILHEQYYDAEGKLICEVKADTEPDAKNPGFSRIKTLKLINAEKEEIDILSLLGIDTAAEKSVRILVSDDKDTEPGYLPKNDTVYMPPLSSPIEMATLLHEIGHHEQYRKDEHFIPFLKAHEKSYEFSASLDKYGFQSPSDEPVKEIIKTLSPDDKKDFITALNDLHFAEQDLTTTDNSKIELLSEKIKKIMLSPTRLFERDATARAFHWMRKIKEKSGIDLFGKIKTKDEAGNNFITDARTELKKYLLGYGATKNNICIKPIADSE